MPQHPEVLWAQRSSESDAAKNIIYFTVNLPNIQENTLKYNLTPTSISFKATSGNAEKGIEEREYEFDLDFYADVVPEESSKRLSTRSLYLVLRKKDAKEEYWPRLTKEKVRNAFIKTDFSKWVDEDEQDGEKLAPEEDMDPMGGMGGMPGMGGMGGMPGLGGMGGDMDFAKMMESMGGAGGMGGLGGLGGAGGGPSGDDDDDSDDDGPPPLEDVEPPK